MFCRSCGKEIPNDSKFCEYCGTKVEKEQINEMDINEPIKEEDSLKSRKSFNKKTLIAGVFGVIAIIGILVFVLTRPDKIQLADLVNRHVAYGINGAGFIEVEDVIYPYDILDCLLESNNNSEDVSEDNFEEFLMGEGEKWDEISKVIDSIRYTLFINGEEVEELYGLTNGDIIKVEVYSENPVSEYFNKKFVKGIVEFEVEGLIDGKLINPFEEKYFTISYSGANGEGEVDPDLNLEYSLNTAINYIEVIDERDNYKNGDPITIRIDYDILEMANFGYALSETTKTFTVEGLGEKVTKDNVSSINEVSLRKYIDYAYKACRNSYDEEYTYYETYLLLDKTVNYKPSLLVVFTYEEFGEDEYIYYEFNDITINENGELSSSNYNESKEPYASLATFGIEDVLDETFYDYVAIDFDY